MLTNPPRSPHAFLHLAQPSVPSLFAAIPECPTVEDTASLLKLWQAVSVLKTRILGPDQTRWPSFVTFALRRFALFASAFASSAEFDPGLHVLPPLDVLWVWHSLLSAPEACYAMFAASPFVDFLKVPFPLRSAAEAIDSAFEYRPDPLAVHNVNALLAGFGRGYTLEYDVSSFDPAAVFLPVFCPVTRKMLASTPLSHFACSSFSVRSNDGIVSHRSLARRQSDASASFPPSRASDESPVFCSPGSPADSAPPSPSSPVSSSATSLSSNRAFSLESASPLVHLTIEDECLQISGDWIDHLVHSPVQNMVEAQNWVFRPGISAMLVAAVDRYKKFWKLLTKNTAEPVPVPTLDIRLVWYAHMSRFVKYADFSIFHTGHILVPPKSGSQTTKDYERTAKMFAKNYHIPYCPCGHYGVLEAYKEPCSLSCYRHVHELLSPSIE